MANHFGERFIKAKDFAGYYSNLASETRDHPSDSDVLSELEYFEKEGLLYPCIRVVVPQEREVEVAKARAIRLQGAKLKWPPDGWPESWCKLEDKLQEYDAWRKVRRETSEHPYENLTGLDDFFSDPKSSPFAPWNSYEFKVSIEGEQKTLDCSDVFYHYWQVHLLDAVRRENTVTVLTTETQRNILDVLRGEVCRPISARPIGSGRYWLVRFANLNAVASRYDQLSKYVSACSRALTTIYRRSRTSYPSSIPFSEDEQAELESLCKSRALRVVDESGISRDDWAQFLRILCDLWFEYDDHGRKKMANELRRDINYLVDFLSDGYGIAAEEAIKLSEKPPRGGLRKKRLELVFPNHIADAKEEALRFLAAIVQGYNENVTPQYQIAKDDIQSICDYAENGDFIVLFHAIQSIESEWQERTQFHVYSQFGHLRSLAIFVEELIKSLNAEIERDESCSETSDPDRVSQTLEPALKTMFVEELWLTSAYDNNACYRCRVPPAEVRSRIDEVMQKSFDPDPSQNFLLQRLFVFKMTRDFGSHKARISHEAFKRMFDIMFYSTLYVMFFVWTYSKNRKALCTQ